MTFNAAGYSLSDTRALGQPEAQTTTSTRPGSDNFIATSTDALQAQTVSVRDAVGNVTSVTRCLVGQTPCTDTSPGALTTRYTYDPRFNDLASVTDPLQHTTTYGYDSAGTLTNITDPLQHQTTFGYNGQGQVTTVTDALQHTTTLAYSGGDLTTITDPLGRVTTRFPDAAGRVLTITNAGQTTRYTYDRTNRVTAVTDALSGQTAFAYFSGGQLQTVTDANQHATSYTYDVMERLASRTDPLKRRETFTYDLNGNPSQWTDRKGQVTTRAYDALDRLHQITYADASTITYTYDARDRLTHIDDSASGSIVRVYDDLDRLTSETTPQGIVSYTYDAADRRATMTVAGQPGVVYTYDNADRLTGLTRDTLTVGITYDNANRRTTLTLSNGIVTEYGYDNADQLTSLTYRNGGITIGDLTYAYDAARRRTGISGAWARTGLPQALPSATYDATNQLTVRGGQTRQYDANGSLASDGYTSFAWDSRGRLSAISGDISATFTYDGVGRRITRSLANASAAYAYDGFNVVLESVAGQTRALLADGTTDGWLARVDPASQMFFLPDILGSTQALAGANGEILAQYLYEPFGATTAHTVDTNEMLFTGREEDDANLYYYRARYYEPSLGRFMSEDPLHATGGERAMSRRLLKFSGGSVDDYATFSTSTTRASC